MLDPIKAEKQLRALPEELAGIRSALEEGDRLLHELLQTHDEQLMEERRLRQLLEEKVEQLEGELFALRQRERSLEDRAATRLELDGERGARLDLEKELAPLALEVAKQYLAPLADAPVASPPAPASTTTPAGDAPAPEKKD